MVDSIKIYNKSTKESIILDKFSAMFLLDDEGIDWGVVTPTISSYPSIYGLGSQVSNVTFQKPREITVTGWVINDNTGTIEQKKKLLDAFSNPLSEIRILVGKYYIDGMFKLSVRYTNKRKENNDIVCKFQLSISCSDPFFRLIEPIKMIDLEVNSTTTWQGWTFNINNPSAFTYGFELYAHFVPGVSVNTFTVYNQTTGKRFSIASGVIFSGETVYLNTVKSKFAFGVTEDEPVTDPPEEFDKINMSGSDFEFVQLAPGVNTISVSCGLGIDLSISLLDIFFNPLFLSFEGM